MPTERPGWLSKPVIDPVNTAAWFLTDAFWLAKLAGPAYLAAGVTMVTGVLLLALARRTDRGELFADLGLNCWIVMNVVWMAHDLNGLDTPPAVAAGLGVSGAGCLLVAARHQRALRRVRVLDR